MTIIEGTSHVPYWLKQDPTEVREEPGQVAEHQLMGKERNQR